MYLQQEIMSLKMTLRSGFRKYLKYKSSSERDARDETPKFYSKFSGIRYRFIDY